MESKLVITFVALATLTRSSWAQQSPDYGLSESQSAQLRGIKDNQDKTLLSNFHSVDPIFDLIEILSTLRKYNLRLEGDGVSSLISGALLTAKNASDHTFNSIPVILGRACRPAEIAWKAAHGDLENVFAQIGSAVGLAVSGNLTDIRTQFQVFTVESEKYLEYFNSRLYDTIRSCIHSTDAETLAAIKDREIESLTNLLRTIRAVFDSIKVLAAGIPGEGDDVAVLPSIKLQRKRAKFAVRNVVEHSYSPIRGLYISTQLNQPENAARFTSEQYAQIVADSRYKEIGDILLDVIRGYLTRVRLGLSDTCTDDSSALDDTEAETTSYFKAALAALVESVPTTDPVVADKAAVAGEFFNNYAEFAMGAYYRAIRLARGQGSSYSEVLKEIETIERELRLAFPGYIRTIFDVVQLGTNTTGDFTDQQGNVVAAALSFVDNIFTATRSMAEACYGIKPVIEEDIKKLDSVTNALDSIVGSFNSDVSSEHVSAIKTFAEIATAAPTVPSRDGVNILIVRPGFGFTFN